MESDVFSGLKILEQRGISFDFIFMDPPYDHGLEKRVLEVLADSPLASRDTVFIVEASLNTDFSWASAMGYAMVRSKEYKTNKHVFLTRKE